MRDQGLLQALPLLDTCDDTYQTQEVCLDNSVHDSEVRATFFVWDTSMGGVKKSWTQAWVESKSHGHKHGWSQKVMDTSMGGVKKSWTQAWVESKSHGHKHGWSQKVMDTSMGGVKKSWTQAWVESKSHGHKHGWS